MVVTCHFLDREEKHSLVQKSIIIYFFIYCRFASVASNISLMLFEFTLFYFEKREKKRNFRAENRRKNKILKKKN